MQIQQFVLGIFETNGYLVWKDQSDKCILIDPADEADKLIRYIHKEGLTPEAILLTHGHYDHFLAVPGLQKEWPKLRVYCHPLDCPKAMEEYDPMMRQTYPTVSALGNVVPAKEGQQLRVAGFDIRVLYMPGHTPGSVIYIMEDAMFSGDTLFCGSIGRTDFAGGDERAMKRSLKRLAAISEDYRVYPGHEAVTTLKAEQKHNPYMKFFW